MMQHMTANINMAAFFDAQGALNEDKRCKQRCSIEIKDYFTEVKEQFVVPEKIFDVCDSHNPERRLVGIDFVVEENASRRQEHSERDERKAVPQQRGDGLPQSRR